MYIFTASGYYVGTEQRCRRGAFLLLLQPRIAEGECADRGERMRRETGPSNTYACVRKVALQQCGHFMMGRVNLCGTWHTVSGGYGNDGLPMDIEKLPKDAKLLPAELYKAWKHGKGWNGPGNEARALRQWARETFCAPRA